MNDQEMYTQREQLAAECVAELAAVHTVQYATPEDQPAAVVAVLRAALELAGGRCNLDRLAVLEREHAEFFDKWHDERRRREAMEAL